MKKIIEIKTKYDLLKRKGLLEEALEILEDEMTDDDYLMLSDPFIPWEENLVNGWYDILTTEDVETFENEREEGEEDYPVSIIDMREVMEEQVADIKKQLQKIEKIIQEKENLLLREDLLERILGDCFEEWGSYIYFAGELDDLEITINDGAFCYLTESQVEDMKEEAGGEEAFEEEYGEMLINTTAAYILFKEKLEMIQHQTTTFKYIKRPLYHYSEEDLFIWGE